LLTQRDATPLFAIILDAKRVAEEIQDQQGIADALSLLGQAHCFASTVASLKSGIAPFSPRGQGKYEKALEEALAVYERWQQDDRADAGLSPSL
jgi:hypothetical protein